MIETQGYAAADSKSPLKPHKYNLKELTGDEVHIKVHYCGLCHTDIHEARDEWGLSSQYPMVPGHEIVGIVESVGSAVTKFKKGDRAGVGFQGNCCGTCEYCTTHREPYCPKFVSSFNWLDYDGTVMQGGFAKDCVIKERFCLKFPDSLDMASGAPLLCAGITVYSPMVHHGMNKPGVKVGIVGMGGLGHMAVKFAKAWGATTVVLSRSESKRKSALEEIKADVFVNTTNKEQDEATKATLDFILDTASGNRDINQYLAYLKVDGVHCMVGLPPVEQSLALQPFGLVMGRKCLCGSLIGGPQAMQDMLDMCGEKKIDCMVEVVPLSYVNEAFERVLKSDVRYRFVLDVAGATFE